MIRSGLLLVGMLGSAVGNTAEPSIDSHKLGVTESLVSYCLKIDEGDAARLKQQVAAMTRGASAATLIRVRNSDDYRRGYDQVTAFVAKVDTHNASRPCSAALAAAKP